MKPSGTPPTSAQAAREVRRDTAMRQARTCYDHLAGVAGVELFDEIFKRGWLEQTELQDSPRVSYRLTPVGTQALTANTWTCHIPLQNGGSLMDAPTGRSGGHTLEGRWGRRFY